MMEAGADSQAVEASAVAEEAVASEVLAVEASEVAELVAAGNPMKSKIL